MKKITLTSILALSIACPAFADITTSNNDPKCDNATIGATSGSTEMEAQWTANTIRLNWYGANGQQIQMTQNAPAASCTYAGSITLPTTPSRPGYTFDKWVVRSTNILASLNISTDGDHHYGHGWYNNADYCYIDGNGNNNNCSNANMTELAVNEWKTEFSYGMIRGKASCQATLDADMAYILTNIDALSEGEMTPEAFLTGYAQVASAEKVATLQDIYTKYLSGEITDETLWPIIEQKLLSSKDSKYTTTSTGQYCFCQVDKFDPEKDGTYLNVSSPSWVFNFGNGVAFNCADYCANDCADLVRSGSDFRSAVFGVAGAH